MKQDKMNSFKTLLIVSAAIAAFVYLSPWRKASPNINLVINLGFTEISKAEVRDKIYCLKPLGFKNNQLNYEECTILSNLKGAQRGDTIDTSEGPIKLNYFVAENENTTIYGMKGKWSCLGVSSLEQLEIKQRDIPWIIIPNCVPRVCDPTILTQIPERGLLRHCINLVTSLSEFEVMDENGSKKTLALNFLKQ